MSVLKYFERDFLAWALTASGVTSFTGGNTERAYFRAGDESSAVPLPSFICTIVDHGPYIPEVDDLYETEVQVDFFSKNRILSMDAADALYSHASLVGLLETSFSTAAMETRSIRPREYLRMGALADESEVDVYVTTFTIVVRWLRKA